MTVLEITVGYLAGWAWRRARRAAGRPETGVDAAIDARLEQLHDLVAGKLGSDAALRRLESEASSDLDAQPTLSDRTRQRVILALEDATDDDPSFAARLADL